MFSNPLNERHEREFRRRRRLGMSLTQEGWRFDRDLQRERNESQGELDGLLRNLNLDS